MNEQPDPLEVARGYARELVRSGFESEEHIHVSVTECMEEFELEDLEVTVRSSIDSEIHSLVADQQYWEHPTDCDRFDRAFEDMKSKGILAQHHYTCCGTCGNFEIDLHLNYERAQGRFWRGYAFYHIQDTESAIKGNGLCLSYGSSDQTEDASIAIGHEVVGILKRHGLEPRWDGTIGKRICLEMDWKRPWPPRIPDVVPEGALQMYQESLARRKKPTGFWSRIHSIFRKS